MRVSAIYQHLKAVVGCIILSC